MLLAPLVGSLVIGSCVIVSLSVGLPFLGTLGGCGASQKNAAEDQDSSEQKESKPKHRKHAPDEDAVSEQGKSWGGWRWSGKRDDCFYVFDNKCFDSKARACIAAICDDRACVAKPGVPSKVSCEE